MMVFIGIQKLHLQTEMDLLIYIIVAFFCRINPETHQFSEFFSHIDIELWRCLPLPLESSVSPRGGCGNGTI